jgi:uncharacterized repeat protein (TIGR01451 family)
LLLRAAALALCGSLLALSTVVAPAAGAAGAPSVYAVSSAVTVRPDQTLAVPAELQHPTADIVAARNEFESVQIVVESGDAMLDNVRVGLSGAGLSGPDGATIPAGNVTLYREASYRVAENKVSDGEGAVGDVPDPLIPDVDPYYRQERSAFVADVAVGRRLVAFVDVLVPQGQAAGQYNGLISVTTAAGTLDTIPLRVRVLPFTLPSTSSLANAFLNMDHTLICQAHTSQTNCGNDQKRWALHSLYGRAGLENRMTISNIAPLGHNEGPPTAAPKDGYFTKYLLPLINGTNPTSPPLSIASEAWTDVRLPGAKLTTQSIYGYSGDHCLAACVADWEAFAQQKGYKSRLWLYACDEPGGSEANWTACEAAGRGLTNQATTLPKLVTAHPKDAKDNGNLTKVDVMVTNVRQLTGKPDCCNDRFERYSDFAPYFDEFMAEPTGAANSQWLYTACDSMGCDGVNSTNPEWDHQLYDGWAGYGIDQPSTQARMSGWLAYLYDARGELYYDVTAKLKTAWTDSFWFGGQGDGTLFYPGIAKTGTGGAAGAVIIGGTDDIPIESLRLKRIRDSREDFEYLLKLDALQGAGAALPLTKDLFGSPEDTRAASRNKAAWTTPDPVDLERVRCDLASAIIGDTACDWDGYVPPVDDAALVVTGSPLDAPAGPNFTFEVRVRNDGPATATGIELIDQLPPGATLVSSGGLECTPQGSLRTCALTDLPAGQSHVSRIVVRPGNEGPMEHWAMATHDQHDPNYADNEMTDSVGPAFICDIRGTASGDVLTGTAAAQVLCGGGGRDRLEGRGGEDLLFGGSGTDTITYARSPEAMVVNLNFQSSGAEGAWGRYGRTGDGQDHLASIERVAGSAFADFLLGRQTRADRLAGGRGSDLIYGYGGGDNLHGGRGNDTLYGGDGADSVDGGDGNDYCRDLTDTLRGCEE